MSGGESVWGKALQPQEAASRMTLRQKQGGFVRQTLSRPVRPRPRSRGRVMGEAVGKVVSHVQGLVGPCRHR